ncbi:MAG: hypothetical protein IAE96_13725 [Chitinophagaceae bacterium]|nr:hypothetical protein [Chitinophagaceae bacterium]
MILAGTSRIAVLCHEKAGGGRSLEMAAALETILHQKKIGHTVFINDWPDHLIGFTDVFISGGDGSLNFFINKYPACQIPLALFRGGSGNDFHWLLYGQTGLEAQVEQVIQATPKPLDAGECNGRLFINGFGAGFEGEVARALVHKKKRPGKSSYLLTILRNIFSYRSQDYIISTESETFTGKRLLVDISNGRRAGGGFHVAPTARADDGKLDLVLAAALPPLKRLYYLPRIEKGKHLHLPVIVHRVCLQVSIRSTRIFPFHMDGEYGEANALDIRILPGRFLFRF